MTAPHITRREIRSSQSEIAVALKNMRRIQAAQESTGVPEGYFWADREAAKRRRNARTTPATLMFMACVPIYWPLIAGAIGLAVTEAVIGAGDRR